MADTLTIDGSRTALLVMDYQNDLVGRGGVVAPKDEAVLKQMEVAMGTTAGAMDVARKAGIAVIHVAVGRKSGEPPANPHMAIIGTLANANAAVEGTWGFAFHDLVQPLPEEMVIVKPLVSAFAGSALDLMLRAQGIHTLAMTGYATNFVVEGTARDAADRGYRVIILEDACVAGNPERHKAAIRNLHLVGTVTDCAAFAAAVGK